MFSNSPASSMTCLGLKSASWLGGRVRKRSRWSTPRSSCRRRFCSRTSGLCSSRNAIQLRKRAGRCSRRGLSLPTQWNIVLDRAWLPQYPWRSSTAPIRALAGLNRWRTAGCSWFRARPHRDGFWRLEKRLKFWPAGAEWLQRSSPIAAPLRASFQPTRELLRRSAPPVGWPVDQQRWRSIRSAATEPRMLSAKRS